MSKHTPTFKRRSFLRGIGACIALPGFESALGAKPIATGAGVTATGAPLRTAFVCLPNGVNQKNWFPREGTHLGETMRSLESIGGSVQVLGGLDHHNASPGHDGGGDHARGNATFLTGARARKTDSFDIKLGVSVDQVIAQQIGHLTRLPSLELSCDSIRKSGGCDGGYSCAYQYNISWASSSLPVAPETNPRLVFERLFGAGEPRERQKNYEMRQKTQRSLLDFVLDDTKALHKRLGHADQGKLDEYLTGLREIEQRIERAEDFGGPPEPGGFQVPAGVPNVYGDHVDAMYDLLALAFQTDSTRVSTLLMAHDGSNRSFPEIGIDDGHHDLSHHKNRDHKLEKVAKIDRYYMEHFARFLKKLDSIKDPDGSSVLQNSMIVYGSGNADGNKHSHDNLPVILAGGGGGALDPGGFRQMGSQPMSNLFLSMADRMGAKGVERIGDSTGRIAAL